MDTEEKPQEKTEEKAGYFVTRVKNGEGVVINNEVEVRLMTKHNIKASLAIKAPKHLPIRKVK